MKTPAAVFAAGFALCQRRAASTLLCTMGVILLLGFGFGAFAQAERGVDPASNAQSTATVVLKEVIVDPSDILSSEDIETLVRGYLDRELTVDELYDLVEAFNAAYQEKGYVAAALLPEQLIDDGVVEVHLVEGRIGNIVVSGNRHTKADFIVKRLGASHGDLVALNVMETGLMAFNDAYDVQLHAELRAGESFGTTDIVVHVLEPDNNAYSLWSDSGGRDEFGLARYGLTWTNRSLFGRRDALTLSLTSGSASRSAALTYSVPLWRGGTRLIATHSYNHIDVVAGEFHDVGIAGDSRATGLTVDIPFRNRRGDRFGVVAGHEQIESSTYFEGHRLTGYTLQTWRVGTSGRFVRQDGANHWGYAYNFTFGHDSVQEGSFSKHTLAGLFQRIFRNDTVLTMTLSGQLTESELLPESEQYKLGGMSTVRGYTSGRLAGDEGYLLNVAWTGMWTPWLRWTLYLDHGGVFPYKGNLEPLGPEDYVTSAAVGFHVQMTEYLHGQFLWGKPLDKDEDAVLSFRLQADF